ncbi:EF-P lysine aminoacylase EpmA [Caenispirillum bisanense]|uniref:Lysyl-tRNA synthetase, class 2 n=1 Tax=Caenispirillum bisanense TaxID=414052 RepID=A0A286GRV1_9PROT|nr:EF-P lysine aminoacylase EpmA [Caenispirillum bisanense]SOD97664.1 lysyl-tRNA synthetase, class 2 [Caenispirillum bisanense]
MAVSPSAPAAGRPWWHPEAVAERLPHLRTRARVIATLRRYFDSRGFLEVETPYLQVAPGAEVHLKAFATELEDPFGGPSQRLYLHTSPEFAMKKLMAGGVPRLYQLARVWRNAERSPTHSPEFTMLEWYRAGAGLEDLMDDCDAILSETGVCPRPAERLSVDEAFRRWVGFGVLETVDDPESPDPDPRPLQQAAAALGHAARPGERWEDMFFRLMLEYVEPNLGRDGRATILHSWPACMAALARRSPADARVAERFEIYYQGIELANAFAELTDPVEQRRRFEHDMALKDRLYGERWPVDEEFLAALELGLPDSAGIALGLDRLVMLAAGVDDIRQVLWAPVGREG